MTPRRPLLVATLPLLLTAGGCSADSAVEELLDVVVDVGLGDTGGADTAADIDSGVDAGDVAADPEADVAVDDAADAGPDLNDDTDAAGDATPDVDGPDTQPDAEPADVRPDVPTPRSCGNGVVEVGEECDDGNDVDDDSCSNSCLSAFCGDGIVNETPGEATFASPQVEWFTGVLGPVCDDGATCPGGSTPSTCDVAYDPEAPEHGICQALGFERASNVVWGGGTGAGATPMLHALNWECWDYYCLESPFADLDSPCVAQEMLASIDCFGIVREECDDGIGNSDSPDACRPDCTLPSCGDAVVDSTEECDDGNRVDDDGCSNRCLLPQCGDGILNGDEECDDGNEVDDDGCRNSCTLSRCGDGVVSDFLRDDVVVAPVVTGPTGATGHVCDDGATCFDGTCDVSTNGSAPEHGICQALGYDRAVTVTWGGGPGESDSSMPHAYNWTCTDFVCSRSTNTFDTDNCSAFEMLASIRCTGGSTEACDEGSGNSDVPGATCRTDCTLPRCGDGVTEPARGEECDDANTVDNDACSNACTLPICGDAIRQGDEECDDGDDSDTNECRLDCTFQRCGDGFLADAEECDDGELNSLEPDVPCRPDCRIARCGDGVPDSGEECDDGNTNDRDRCVTGCLNARCGDGIRQAVLGEDCDDGNDIDDDDCANDCTGLVEGFGACADFDLGSATGEVARGSTSGESATYGATCASGAPAADIAYNWVAPTTGRYVFSMEGSDYDTALHIRAMPETVTTNECNDGPQIACNDDFIGLQSQITIDVEAGSAYLVIVDGYSTSTGSFVLTINPG
ncbi:MAG: DUF4215 domain-containing protein [Myxococcales bacterium]|nr:DUF4215 domain-containing protein [Myxococcales bacterium]MCB9532052.1 DUF4215 domain-containing protein [Myxococcales bacterium]